MSGYISTASGGRFYFAKPDPSMVNIEDVATAESHLCRFTGQCRWFYTVAEHSWHVSYLVPPELALCGLLHDATEPYVNDLAKPLKNELPDYQAVERRVWEMAIAPAFGLPLVMPDAIKAADFEMLRLEIEHLLPAHCLHDLGFDKTPRVERKVHCWQPQMARYMFKTRYEELTA